MSSPSISDPAEDESMVVHPATQAQADEPTDDAASDEDVSASQKLWPVKSILDEKRNAYLLQWAGIDPSTGEEWKPSWESKINATPELIFEWNKRKTEKATRRRSKGRASSTSASSAASCRKPTKTFTAPPVSTSTTTRTSKASFVSAPSEPLPIKKRIAVVAKSDVKGKKVEFALDGSPRDEEGKRRKLEPSPRRETTIANVAEDARDSNSLESVVPDSQSQGALVAVPRDVDDDEVADDDRNVPGTGPGAHDVDESDAEADESVLVLPSSRADELKALDADSDSDAETDECLAPAPAPESRKVRSTAPPLSSRPLRSSAPSSAVSSDSDSRPAPGLRAPAVRPLGRIPVPSNAAFFALRDNGDSVPASSQDPIEDPDSPANSQSQSKSNSSSASITLSFVGPARARARPSLQLESVAPIPRRASPSPSQQMRAQSSQTIILTHKFNHQPVAGPFGGPRRSVALGKRPIHAPPPVLSGGPDNGGGVVARALPAQLPQFPLPDEFDDLFHDLFDFVDVEPLARRVEPPMPESSLSDGFLSQLGEDGRQSFFGDCDRLSTLPTGAAGAGAVDADAPGPGGGSNGGQPPSDLPVSNGAPAGGSYYNVYAQQPTNGGSAATPARAGWGSEPNKTGNGNGNGNGNGHSWATGGSALPTSHSAGILKRDHVTLEEDEAANKKARTSNPTELAVAPQPLAASLAAVLAPAPSSGYLSPVMLPSPSLSRVQAAGDIFVNTPAQSAGGTPSRQRSPSPAPAASLSSRNGSPAPGGSQASILNLQELIRNSVLLDGQDQTKPELSRFVASPATYISSGDAPLTRRPFWAFGLRVAPGDKTDIIVVNSTEGSYQLKRVLSNLLPSFDVARSLAHVTPTPRAPVKRDATPVNRDATPVRDPTPIPEPPQVLASSLTREDLEKEFDAVRLQLKSLASELAQLRPLAAETLKLRSEVASLTKSNKSLQSSKEAASTDFSYIQRQYSEASNAAVDRANEARVAEATAERLQGLLDVGLVQRDLFQKGESRKHKEHIKRLELEVGLLKGESRRTDAGVRAKAALWDTHVATLKIEEVDRALDEDETLPTQTQPSQEVFQCAWRETPSHACEAVLPTREALLQHATVEHLPPPIARLVSSA